MNEANEIIKAINSLAAAIREENSIPEKAILWDRSTLCKYYGVSETMFDRTIVCRPDFPDPCASSSAPSAGQPGR